MNILSEKHPWYAAGLAFECARCGRCCSGPQEGYVWVTDAEIDAIAKHLGMTADELRRRHLRRVKRRWSLLEQSGNKDCIFLAAGADGGKGCLIYHVRPRQCRTWPFWSGNLVSPGAWAMAQKRCEGINRGRVLRHEEIQAMSAATRE